MVDAPTGRARESVRRDGRKRSTGSGRVLCAVDSASVHFNLEIHQALRGGARHETAIRVRSREHETGILSEQ